MKRQRKTSGYKIVWISACLFLLLALSGQPAEAATHSGTCGTNAKWNYNKKTKTLTISGKGAVTLNRKKKGYLEANIKPKKLVVKPGITSITCYNNNHTFHYNEFQLEEVSLPNSLRSIQGPLFMNCEIATLTIPKKVKQLNAIPFLDANIKELKVHQQNKYFTVSKEGILFSKNRKTLLYYPRNCKMKKYEIPKSVTKIGEMAFYDNYDLRNVILTKQIQKIGDGAFSYCNNLKKINMQVTKVKEIQDYNGKAYGIRRYFGYYPIEYTSSEYTTQYEVDPDTLFLRVSGRRSWKKWFYPDNIHYFGTFQGTRLQSFVMPDTMKYAGKQTFYPDRNRNRTLNPGKKNYDETIVTGGTLKRLVIGEKFCGEINGGKYGSENHKTTLDLHFSSHSKGFLLETIQVHKNNQKYKVQNHVLYSSNMDTIYLAANSAPVHLIAGKTVHYVARGAFYENKTIQSVTFQGNINRINDSAFEFCSNLKTVKCMGTVDRIGQCAFYWDYKMVMTAEKIRYIDQFAFRNTKKCTFDTSEVTYIGTQAFQRCKISSLKINGPIEYIGTLAFDENDDLTEIEIHSTKALKVDDAAFCNLKKIQKASLTSEVSLTLGQEIFYDCISLEKVFLSKGTDIPKVKGLSGEFPSLGVWGIKIEWL